MGIEGPNNSSVNATFHLPEIRLKKGMIQGQWLNSTNTNDGISSHWWFGYPNNPRKQNTSKPQFFWRVQGFLGLDRLASIHINIIQVYAVLDSIFGFGFGF